MGALLSISAALLPAQTTEVSGATGQRLTLPAAVANDSALEAKTAVVAAQLRCPVCQGLSIQDSPSELSQQMRNLVKEQLAAGKSPDEVKAYFVSKYGEWILLEPKAKGFNLLIYLLPVLLVLGGIGAIVFIVHRWTATAAVPEPADGAEHREI